MPLWYEKWEQRLQKEKFEMERRHPKLQLEKLTDDRLAWAGELYSNNDITYHVRIIYPPEFPMRSPRVYPISPNEPERLKGAPHYMMDGSLCLAYPTFESPAVTAADVADAARMWLMQFELFIKTGTWAINNSREMMTNKSQANENVVIQNFGTMVNSPIQQGNVSASSSASMANQSEIIANLLEQLTHEVGKIIEVLPKETAREVEQDLDTLKSEVNSKKPRKKWYELSAEGLIKAATTIGTIGKPVLEIVTQILSTLRSISP